MNVQIPSVAFLGNSNLAVAARPSGDEIEISHIALDPGELIQDACSRLTRNFTREEWDHYLPGEGYRPTCPNLPPDQKAP
jgi:hypothetical protein